MSVEHHPAEFSVEDEDVVVDDGLMKDDDEDVNKKDDDDMVPGGSMLAAVFGVIKGTVGPAILYLPHGFVQAGTAVAVPSLILATVAYLYSCLRLLDCWKIEHDRDILKLRATHGQDYGSILSTQQQQQQQEQQNSIHHRLTYPELARRALGEWSWFVVTGIALMQLGVCLTYLIFVPQNLVPIFKYLFGVSIDLGWFVLAMVLLEIPLVWIQDIRKLAPANMMASCFIAIGLLSIVIWCFVMIHQDQEENVFIEIADLQVFNSQSWYLFIGTAFFAFEGGITLLVPLQAAIYRSRDQPKFPSANQTTTTWIVIFYIFFGFTCWLGFGDTVSTALTTSLPPGVFATFVQLLYSIAVFFTFPLQAFPAMQALIPMSLLQAGNTDGEYMNLTTADPIDPSSTTTTRTTINTNQRMTGSVLWKRNAITTLIILLLGVVAYIFVNSLSNVVSLLGSLVGMPVALIFPPLMYNALIPVEEHNGHSSTTLIRKLNYFCVVTGIFATGATSLTTILGWSDDS